MAKKNSKSSKDQNKKRFSGSKDSSRAKSDDVKKGRSTSSSRSDAATAASDDYVRSTKSPVNDPAWYNQYPELTESLGTAGFTHVTGTPIKIGSNYMYEGAIWINRCIPNWGGTLGNDGETLNPSPLSGIQATANKIYAFVVHRNGRHPGYQAKDLMLMVMAIDGIYMHIREAERVYRLATSYDPQNAAASNMITALGWKVADVRANLANFRYSLDYATELVNKFMIPNIFPIIQFHNQQFSTVYVDEPSTKAQYIADVPIGVWVYNDEQATLNFYTSLTGVSGWDQDGGKTPAGWIDTFNVMYKNIAQSEYMGTMQGDLLNAFGSSLQMSLVLSLDVPLIPIYDEEFVYKWHNITLVDNCSAKTAKYGSSLMVYRDSDKADGTLYSYLGTKLTKAFPEEDCPLDLSTATPNPVTLMIMGSSSCFNLTHYSASVKWDGINDQATTVENVLYGYYPLYFVGSCMVYYLDSDGALQYLYTNASTSDDKIQTVKFNFKHAPLTKVFASGKAVTSVWDTNNVTVIDQKYRDRVNYVTFASLWKPSLPSVAAKA